ncbi:MAG: hypothetical protein P8Z31_04660 [Gammaproteobacteria bacterium]|jgi:hypothetical protein
MGKRPVFRWLLLAIVVAAALNLGACSTNPLLPYTAETPPLMLMPASRAGVQDKRARFREIFCKVLEERGTELPDYRPCDEALARVGQEPKGTGRPVELGQSRRRLVAALVPGVGWDCIADWLDASGSVPEHVNQFGYDQVVLDVDGLSSSSNNARQIRDAIMAMPMQGREPRLVLIGYSKGATDILEAVVSYPEIRPRIAAVVSTAGTIGGSPLANNADRSMLALFRKWPGAQCSRGDNGAIESLRTDRRKAWLAQNPLPPELPYYSLVTFPEPGRISTILKPTYNMLSRVDARNDSQVIFYDQVIPDSSLVGYLNADHWALAVPIARTHASLGATFVNRNDFPREALLEALLRFIEEDLEQSSR